MLLPTVDLQSIRCVTMDFQPFMARMLDPSHFLTHLPYALLVLSMLMNSMGWLRAIAIAAGLIRIVNRAFFEVDPIVVFWEVIFVAVNVGQLMILWYYARRHRFAEHERHFADSMPAGVERRTIRRLLKLSRACLAEPGQQLTTEGAPVGELIFVAEGVVQIKDLIEGKRLSGEIEDNTTWREARVAQVSVPEAELVAKVREILDAQAEDRARQA